MEQLQQLADKWDEIARSKFMSAKQERQAMQKSAIEHGAWCYFNCAQELRRCLASPAPEPSAKP